MFILWCWLNLKNKLPIYIRIEILYCEYKSISPDVLWRPNAQICRALALRPERGMGVSSPENFSEMVHFSAFWVHFFYFFQTKFFLKIMMSYCTFLAKTVITYLIFGVEKKLKSLQKGILCRYYILEIQRGPDPMDPTADPPCLHASLIKNN